MSVIVASAIKDMAMPLDRDACAAFCCSRDFASAGGPGTVHAFGPCSSALDVAWQLHSHETFGIWDSVICASQWAGRGQLRRRWVSESGNLFAAWRLPVPPKPWQNLVSVLVGWCLCRVFEELGVGLQIKWPNDLLADGRKVGGILLEERGDVLLAGIGMNLMSHPDDALMRSEAACPASHLGQKPVGLTALGLWLQLVDRGRFWYERTLSTTAPQTFVQLIEPVMAYLGQRVVMSDNRSSFSGVFDGLRSDGGIVVRSDEMIQVFHSGSLSPV